MMCEACQQGAHWFCNCATWCDCDCDGPYGDYDDWPDEPNYPEAP
jgi:hypothetical protein